MRTRPDATAAIWLVSTGIGLLFLARGAFQPYLFPLFESLGGFSYAQIALLLNAYVLAQSFAAPLAGWYIDRTSLRIALLSSILLGVLSFLAISSRPGLALSAAAVTGAGLAFVLGKISLNTILVLESGPGMLRRSVAKRATLLNLGSFIGNSLALRVTAAFGYRAHALLLAALYLPLAVGLAAPSGGARSRSSDGQRGASMGALLRNRAFQADALRRFAIVLPYGCWGTVIPKYVIDQYGSNDKVWTVYLASLLTSILGAGLLAATVSPWLDRRGFKWEWWSMVSLGFYIAGLGLLTFGGQPLLLPVAVTVFILGEVVMGPCFDETARKHARDAGMASCMGLLHLVDGLGRLIGAAVALGIYGMMRQGSYREVYWPVVALGFLGVSAGLHGVAASLTRGLPEDRPAPAAVTGSVPVSNGVAAP